MIGVLVVFFFLIIGYASFEARHLLLGPSITLEAASVTTVDEPYVLIRGRAQNIQRITLNGGAIAVTESGAFQEPYLLQEGYNIVTLAAEDKLGREVIRELQIVYTPKPELHPPPAATSTITS